MQLHLFHRSANTTLNSNGGRSLNFGGFSRGPLPSSVNSNISDCRAGLEGVRTINSELNGEAAMRLDEPLSKLTFKINLLCQNQILILDFFDNFNMY